MTDAPAFKYWAFISYSHADEAWAKWLHQSIETYRVPRHLVGRTVGGEPVPRRLFPVFRDRDELPSSHELGAVINRALAQSRNLIVVCSPRSATSRWVNEEIKAFRGLGRSHRVFCLIVDGEPHASARPDIAFSECFPPALREEGFEPIAADARERKDGKAAARLKLLAGLIDVGYDELKQREKQRAFWQRLQQAGLALAVVAALAGTTQWFLAQRDAREKEIRVEQLIENGRLELLEGRQARAAVYLNAARQEGADSPALRFMLGQAMLPVDAMTNVRVRHGGTTVRRAIFSPDGKRFVLIVAQHDDVLAKVYDAATAAELIVLKRVPAYPKLVQFLGDGSRLLVTGYAQVDASTESGPSVAVWALDTPEPLFTLTGNCGRTGLPVARDGTLALGSTRGLLLLDSTSGTQRKLLEAGRSFTALSYSGDSRWLATADDAGKIELRDGVTGKVARELAGFEGQPVVGLAFTPDSARVLGLSRYGDVRLWDLASGSLKVAFGADPAWVSGIQFSDNGLRLLTIGSEGYKVWSAARGVLLFDIRNALSRDATAVLSRDGDFLHVADDTSPIAEIWAVRGSTRLQTLEFHADSVAAIALDADGHRLLLASKDGTAGIWRAHIAPTVRFDTGTAAPNRALWSGADDRLVVVGEDKGLGMMASVDPLTGAVLAIGEGHRAFVAAAALSQDRRHVLTAGHDGLVGLWDAALKSPGTLLDLKLPFNFAGFSQNGSRAVALGVAAHDGVAGYVLDPQAPAVVAPLKGDVTRHAHAFSPDGATLATADVAGNVQLLRTADGTESSRFQAHQGVVDGLAFDSAGRRIVTGGQDHAVRLWPATGGALIAELDDVALGWVLATKFSPDDRRIAIGTIPGTVWLWDPQQRTALPLKGHRSAVTSLTFAHGGSILLTTGYDGVIRAWDARSGSALAIVGALGGVVHAVDLTRNDAFLAAGSAVTRFGGVWPTAMDDRPAETVSQILRCRVPWQEADARLVRAASGDCRDK